MRVLLVRHPTTPTPEGCRWCGTPQREHPQTWIPGHGWHGWTEPTRQQIAARMRARLTRKDQP
ncbi:hypothetical protein GA0070563_1126 [Micromonospora carbonacea]|uniref:Uncharacterized protein n=1 Tax=Micromonospora carbonacea TaxID=47853 RepID=A0A1C5AA11_9ACTN|nr:hypothetical protein GA0070563_1126 [Micromonospora carbonacea]